MVNGKYHKHESLEVTKEVDVQSMAILHFVGDGQTRTHDLSSITDSD